MYTPPAFRDDEPTSISALIAQTRLATLVTATAEGLMGTPLPLFLDEAEGPHGTLYGHLARANRQASVPAIGEALAIFQGPDAYVTPSWYRTKQETGKVVPTWNYAAVHAYGEIEFFDDETRLHAVVSRLTDLHESARETPWAVTDAPPAFVRSQLKGISGFRLPIGRIDAKRKMSQNRSPEDRAGVAEGLGASDLISDRIVAGLIPTDPG
ncbi:MULTISPECIES: FMN-binding negative transcriptional regulator [unclassified Aureimonas]|uniref:FMN-binding negative transcriptional regulator n=1 Tax=unclassified Aureimonas TaxID=2615206 RepID=UPI0006FA46A1|nr:MULTISPECIES: FMN-binding negative transcriptional regulator [unclassified Aureimonas]KQT64192.1 transcriptional regulator [Aureimonas sp. Leaf427]KQT81381.1 transcriptional regulator [Aureimonas sp. Leaf460]